MTELRKLGGRFTPEARAYVDGRLNTIKSYAPTLGLLYGIDPEKNNGSGSWSTVAYGEENVTELVEFYARFGAAVKFELDGLPVVVPQIGRLSQLDSGALELRNNRLCPSRDNA